MTAAPNTAALPLTEPRIAVFPLSRGEMRVQWPTNATADDWDTIGEYLALMITKQKSLAAPVTPANEGGV